MKMQTHEQTSDSRCGDTWCLAFHLLFLFDSDKVDSGLKCGTSEVAKVMDPVGLRLVKLLVKPVIANK